MRLNRIFGARDVGTAPPTANQWLSILEASGPIVLLERWFSNRTKSIIKSPKLYLADTGVLFALLIVRSQDALRQSPSAGAIVRGWRISLLISFALSDRFRALRSADADQ